jgi:hypothetical protein
MRRRSGEQRLDIVARLSAEECGQGTDRRFAVFRALSRQASSHLPLVLTVQVIDPRTYLRVEKLSRSRMEIAPG